MVMRASAYIKEKIKSLFLYKDFVVLLKLNYNIDYSSMYKTSLKCM